MNKLSLALALAVSMTGALDFDRDGKDWPMHEASRFVVAQGICWHVQVTGAGPVLLLVHGTGASTHSWRRLVPLLNDRFTVVVADLPGHAFTSNPGASRLSLDGMSSALSALMREMHLKPVLAAGHSAGAAILVRATLDGGLSPSAIVSLNGALLPFGGAAGAFFSPLAKMVVAQSWVPRLMAWRARDRRAVVRLMTDMGSTLADEDIDYYARLFRNPDHVAATLSMMANWDLSQLQKDMPRLDVPLVLVAAANDRAIPPSDAERVRAKVSGARIVPLPGLGHLAHEERPGLVAGIIDSVARELAISQSQ